MNQVILKKLNESVRPDFAMAKRVIAVGDVHGQFNLLRDLVENQIKFDPTSDVLVFLGDYIDRGRSAEDEIAVLNYLIDLHNGNPGKIVLLRGNHEQMAINAISNADCEEEQWLWKHNGSKLYSISDLAFRSGLVRFCQSLPLYIEDEWVFVHAGAYPNIPLEKQPESVLLWDRTENNFGYFDKLLIVGHTPNQIIQKTEKIVYVDTGAFYYGCLSAYDPKNDTEYSARGPARSLSIYT
ncbi:MAG TPA: metallophosphoesterase family protein [Candidatus Rifleibacterium sp.]|nr:metallophosphoesterase family protein [Candidatus Rifleibacterium sp.]